MQITVSPHQVTARGGSQDGIDPTPPDSTGGRADFGQVFRQGTQDTEVDEAADSSDQDATVTNETPDKGETHANKVAHDSKPPLSDAHPKSDGDESIDRLPEAFGRTSEVNAKADRPGDLVTDGNQITAPAAKPGKSINETIASAYMTRDRTQMPVSNPARDMDSVSTNGPRDRAIIGSAEKAVPFTAKQSSDRTTAMPSGNRDIPVQTLSQTRPTVHDAQGQTGPAGATPNNRDAQPGTQPIHATTAIDTTVTATTSHGADGRIAAAADPPQPRMERAVMPVTPSATGTDQNRIASSFPTPEMRGRDDVSTVTGSETRGTSNPGSPAAQSPSVRKQNDQKTTNQITGHTTPNPSTRDLDAGKFINQEKANGRSLPTVDGQAPSKATTAVAAQGSAQPAHQDVAANRFATSAGPATNTRAASTALGEVAMQPTANPPTPEAKEAPRTRQFEGRSMEPQQADIPKRNAVQNTTIAPAPPIIVHTAEPSARGDSATFDDIAWDLRPHAAPTATPAQIMQARPEMPPHIAQQLAQAMHRSPDRPLEIALNPAELGRVRMTLTATEAGITVNILADRPDTLDLMRRNIDDLGQSFADLGYEDIAFAFGQNGDPSDTENGEHSDGSGALVLDLEQDGAPVDDIPNSPRLAILAEGVDIRL